MLIKYVYIVFLGLILATFVGVGIAAFYKGPEMPDYPAELSYPIPAKPDFVESSPSAERLALQKEHDAKFKDWTEVNKQYEKNVSMIALGFAVLMLVVSLTIFKKIPVIADGLLLGGVLTLGYSIVRGFASDDDIFRFLVVGVGLVTAMVLGYLKFVAPQNKKKN